MLSSIVIIEADHASTNEAETVDAIRAQVGDLSVTVDIELRTRPTDLRAQMSQAARVASEHHARGVFWVDTDASGDTLLFMFDPNGEQLLSRRIHHEGEQEAVNEEVADVAHGIIEALAEGRHVGMTLVEAPHETPKPRRHVPHRVPIAVRASSHASIAFGAGIAGESWTSRAPWSAGTALFAEARFGSGGVLRAEYTFFETLTAEGSGATIRLARHPIDVAAGWDARVKTVSIGVELGATLDPVARETTFVSADGAPTPSRVSWTFALSPRARLGWQILPWLGVYARAGVDVFLAQSSYAIGNASVFAPDVARLRVDAGFAFTAWGAR